MPPGGTTPGGTTAAPPTGGTTTKSSATMGASGNGSASAQAGGMQVSGTATAGTTVTLDAFAQEILAEIEQMVVQQFGPLPQEVVEFLALLILRDMLFDPDDLQQPPVSGVPSSTTSPPGA